MSNPTFKFACPHCGQHLEAEPDWEGMESECPECGETLTVPPPPPVLSPEAPSHADTKATSRQVSEVLSGADTTAIPDTEALSAADNNQPTAMQEDGAAGYETVRGTSSRERGFRLKSFFVSHREMIATIASVLIAPVVVRVAFLEPVYHNDYTSHRYDSKPVQGGQSGYSGGGSSYGSAWASLTRDQQLAMGKVMYMFYRFTSMQQQATNVDSSQVAGMTLLMGVAAANLLPQVNDDDAPEDFRRAWRKYAVCLAASNVGNAFESGSSQYGGGLSAQDLGNIRMAKEELAKAQVAFLRIIAKYGVDNLKSVSEEVQAKIDSGQWSINDLLREQKPKPQVEAQKKSAPKHSEPEMSLVEKVMAGKEQPPKYSHYHLDDQFHLLPDDGWKGNNLPVELWNARIDYDVANRQPPISPTLYDRLMLGKVNLPKVSDAHHLNAKTGLLYRNDGKPLDFAAQLWNIQMKFDCSGRRVSSPPTLFEEVATGKVQPPRIQYHVLDESGHLLCPDGELDIEADVWNARMDYSAARCQPSSPPTLYDKVMLGDVKLHDKVIHGNLKLSSYHYPVGHHFDPKTGFIYRRDNQRLCQDAVLWNLRMKYSLSGCTPSSPPTLLDEIAAEKAPRYNFSHVYLDEEGFYHAVDSYNLPNELVIWNQRMKAAYSMESK